MTFNNSNNLDSSRISFSLFDYCSIYIVCWAIIPAMSRNVGFRYLALICSVVVFATVISKRNNRLLLNYTILSVILFFIIALHSFIGNVAVPVPKCINISVFLVLGVIAQYYYIYDLKKQNFIARTVIVIYLLIIIPSLIAIRSNPYTMRNASGERVRAGIELFAGSYGYVFGCVMLVIFLAYNLSNNYCVLFNKALQLVAIVALFYLILNSGLTTSIVVTIIGVVAALCFKKSRILTILGSTVAFVILIYLIPWALRYISINWDISVIYQSKLEFLISLFDSSSSTTYADSTRGKLFYKGLTAIAHYPVLGSIIITGSSKSGGHQEIIDVMANYGLIYAMLYYRLILWTPYKLIKSDKALRFLYLFVIIIIGLTDNYDYATIAVPLFVGPYIVSKQPKYNKDN